MMRRSLLIAAVVVCTVATVSLAGPERDVGAQGTAEAWAPERPWEVIDVAIALDTSGSMDNLIDAARLKLWEIVNDLTLLEPTPQLRVALLSYGHGKNDPKAGWVRVETDLTEDLDLVSERLFALTSQGGTEYVGRVLQAALEELSWTPSRDALKLVFVAGNEPADQDPKVSFQDMTHDAVREGIFVHPIFCGNADHPHAETWKELADLAQGRFAAIDHRGGTVVVKTPFDEQLAELGKAINETYIPFGEKGEERLERQAAQDAKAMKLSPAAAAGRAQAKASPLYSAEWDLIDALVAEQVSLYELEESELPEQLREMTFEEREIFIEDTRLKREELRRQIAELAAKRQQYVAEQIEKKGIDTSRAFDTAVRQAIREKAEERGFEAPKRGEDR